MSSLLFDIPGPKAKARHRLYAVGFLVVLLGLLTLVARTLYEEEVLTPTVLNDAFQNRNIEFMLEGLLYGTLKAAGLGIVGSLVLGIVLAVGRLSEHWYFRMPVGLFIEFFRAVPLVLLIVFLYFGLRFEPLWALVVALWLYNGSVLAEVFRAGVNAVSKGQSEAAYALGMRKTQVMMIVLLPQAVKFMLPAIISQCVIVLKDTSLGALIVYGELVRNARLVAQDVNDGTIVVYATAALVFIAINYSLSKLAEYLQRRSASRGGGPDRPIVAPNLGEMSGGGGGV